VKAIYISCGRQSDTETVVSPNNSLFPRQLQFHQYSMLVRIQLPQSSTLWSTYRQYR